MSSSSTFSTANISPLTFDPTNWPSLPAKGKKGLDLEKPLLIVPIETRTRMSRGNLRHFESVYRKETKMTMIKKNLGNAPTWWEFSKRQVKEECFFFFFFKLGLCKAASKGVLCKNEHTQRCLKKHIGSLFLQCLFTFNLNHYDLVTYCVCICTDKKSGWLLLCKIRDLKVGNGQKYAT